MRSTAVDHGGNKHAQREDFMPSIFDAAFRTLLSVALLTVLSEIRVAE